MRPTPAIAPRARAEAPPAAPPPRPAFAARAPKLGPELPPYDPDATNVCGHKVVEPIPPGTLVWCRLCLQWVPVTISPTDHPKAVTTICLDCVFEQTELECTCRGQLLGVHDDPKCPKTPAAVRRANDFARARR